ncbi:hypothetical protein LTR62_007277 [Meristemomyces frigidus]|uniref:Sec39 domain-containing protein n=1 Tax=Meristemomyces frigidus TaxID=1508187 RepID=A0AAN7YDQ6_9PEZI|nr:hypothetical protein LTR62_007277 [Meristemomyces frigidus]
MAKELSKAKCILLAVHLASASNIKALHSFTPIRSDALDPELVLRILLTYLPESVDPREYVKYVEEVGTRLYLDVQREHVEVDVSPVKDIPEEQAQKRAKKLNLLDLQAALFPPHSPEDLLTRFLCHRALRIDEETGFLHYIPLLMEPFLPRNEYLKTWYISVVLPIERLEVEYYPNDPAAPQLGLKEFTELEGPSGVDVLMQKAQQHDGQMPMTSHSSTTIGRDVKCLVGPWMYGYSERKRRKLFHTKEEVNSGEVETDESRVEFEMRKISLSGISAEDQTGHDWEYLFRWLVRQAANHNFILTCHCVEDWDGPSDVDFGGYSQGGRDYMDDGPLRKLESQYAQAAFASCYVVQEDTQETIKGAHGILARLAELLDFIPPPDLASSIDALPRVERHATKLENSEDRSYLSPTRLLTPEHPLTSPRLETYMLLQMFVYSAYQFDGLGNPISIVHCAKLHFYATADEQLAMLQKILKNLASRAGRTKDDTQWTAEREKLIWLWNWGIDADDPNVEEGAGVLGKINRKAFEEEMLKVFVECGCYGMAKKLYLDTQSISRLDQETVERVVLAKALEAYDGASNGNKTRGGVRKAHETILAFKPYFSNSKSFQQATSLIAATHALSFYSLTLQHGVPFQPVNIRASSDPISLIDKVLEQNPRSYTKLDDLVEIGRNLISAGLPQSAADNDPADRRDNASLDKAGKEAERRVTFMAVEAALREDDFETAYSYIVNRLTPSGAGLTAPSQAEAANTHSRSSSRASVRTKKRVEDDISWRAAFLAGRYRPNTFTPPTLRRLEQRTELLSLALLLAPTAQLTDILAVWRRCEEETTALQRSQQQAEQEFDDRADKRGSISALPGNFTLSGDQPEMVLDQTRREMGRLGGTAGAGGAAGASAPMSMFDLTRSAASAFSRNAFPLSAGRTATQEPKTESRGSGEGPSGMEGSVESLGGEDGQQRVRKRDMVVNVVEGGLSAGLGWVLGAKPAGQ